MAQSSRSKANSWPYPRYKDFEVQLRASNQRWFAARGLTVNPRMPYLLARWEDWPGNIIVPEVVQYINEERARRKAARVGFSLNKYVHNGLSSQAMLFNLVGPLVVRNDFAPLRAACESGGIAWPVGEIRLSLEYEDRAVFNEDARQPTSIDLVVQGEPALFIEAKLVERKFGGCSIFAKGNCDGRNPVHEFGRCYLHRIGRAYWKKLEEFGFTEGPLKQEKLCPLAVHYQFFREVLFALARGGTFVLLYDERNPTFFCQERGVMPLLREFVPEAYQERVQAIQIQAVVESVRASGCHPWIGEFERKYGLD